MLFLENTIKSYDNNIFRPSSEMRALCSQIKKWRFFSSVRDGLLQNGHFKNVQNRFPNNKPRIAIFQEKRKKE